MLAAEPITLNELLKRGGLDLRRTLVWRHRPFEPSLNRVFQQIVQERADLFDCYQSTHGPRTEASLLTTDHVASFIRNGAGQALFVGLYRNYGSRRISKEECLARPAHRELTTLGMSGFHATTERNDILEFDLRPTGWHSDWHGRLIINWPPPDRAWYRRADRNVFAVEAIARENILRQATPPWNEIALTWAELQTLPSSWEPHLSQWRGIYLITDSADGKYYVGSAYGAENILQRWREYGRTGHGGNKHLRNREPAGFRFSILQRVSPDADEASVIHTETTWKQRLSTRYPAGLNEN